MIKRLKQMLSRRPRMERREDDGHWMEKAFSHNKGALHEQLHTPLDEKIPMKKLMKAEHSRSPKLRHRALAAINAQKRS